MLCYADEEQTEIVAQLAATSMQESRNLNVALAEILELRHEVEALRRAAARDQAKIAELEGGSATTGPTPRSAMSAGQEIFDEYTAEFES